MSSPVNPGDILMEKYRIDRILGMGGMGIVVAATHIGLEQRVAIKFMLANKVATQEQYQRFVREARAAVRLKSEHVARVSDVGAMESGAPYMVMEYLDGRDLSAVLADRGPLPIAEAIDHVLQACEAVGEAHAAGIIHRDLKPANLFLTTSAGGAACVKVLDFGISKTSDSELQLTQETAILGSPLYMSPEQMRASRDTDSRADIWALGVVLYQLLTNTTPFHADQVQALCARVFFGEPTPIATLRSDIPPGLEAAILQCLEKDRARRWRNVADLAAAIAPFGSARASGYAERVAGVLGMQVEPARATNLLPVEAPTAARTGNGGTFANTVVPAPLGVASPRSKASLFAVAGLAVAVLSLGGFGLARWRASADVAPQPAISAAPGNTASTTVPDAAIVPVPAASSVAVAATVAPSATPSATIAAANLPPKARLPAHPTNNPAHANAAPSATAAPTVKKTTSYEKD